eukprot:39079-Eustigmatos_ZCMA.PRE.1
MRFYNPALHTAAFALPEFARRRLEDARVRGGVCDWNDTGTVWWASAASTLDVAVAQSIVEDLC